MTNTINMEMRHILVDALGEYGNAFNRIYIFGNEIPLDRKAIKWTAGWASIGDVDPSEAADFATKLGRAAEIADALNAMKMNMVYKHDAQVEELFSTDKDMVYRFREQMIEALEQAIARNEWGKVAKLALNRPVVDR